MRLELDDLEVFFPYDSVYPEQLAYMTELKKALDAGGHAVLEMPSGTGKTITLLSLITSYVLGGKLPEARKLVYCTRTVEEMQKVLGEMRILSAYRSRELGASDPLVCVGLASRYGAKLKKCRVIVDRSLCVEKRRKMSCFLTSLCVSLGLSSSHNPLFYLVCKTSPVYQRGCCCTRGCVRYRQCLPCADCTLGARSGDPEPRRAGV